MATLYGEIETNTGNSMRKKGKEPVEATLPQKAPLQHVLLAVLLIMIWQLGIYFSKSSLDDNYKNLAATGIGENYSTFAYFYYYLDLFPLTSTLLFTEEGIPEKYWSEEGALTLIEEAPETLVMDFEGYIRTGDYGKIWLFFPEIILTGNPNNLNVHEFLAFAFTTSLIALLVSFWRVDRFNLGLALVIFIGSHPYQLYEVYNNPNVFQNMGNWFSIPITSFVFLLAAFAQVIFGEKLSRISITGLSILGGAYFGMVSHIRIEPAALVVSCVVIILLYKNETFKMRVVFALLVLITFIVTRTSIDDYFDRKFVQTIKFVQKLNVPIAPKLRTSHIVWHPVWLGLGDFDKKFGIEWRDQVAIDYVKPRMVRDGTYDFSQVGTDANIWDIPVYDEYLRADFFSKVKADPLWYLEIFGKRFVRNTMEVTPVQIAVSSLSIRLFNFGALSLIVLLLVAQCKKWEYVCLIIVTTPLAFTAMLVYSGSGMTYVNVHQQVSASILVVLVWEWMQKNKTQRLQNQPELV